MRQASRIDGGVIEIVDNHPQIDMDHLSDLTGIPRPDIDLVHEIRHDEGYSPDSSCQKNPPYTKFEFNEEHKEWIEKNKDDHETKVALYDSFMDEFDVEVSECVFSERCCDLGIRGRQKIEFTKKEKRWLEVNWTGGYTSTFEKFKIVFGADRMAYNTFLHRMKDLGYQGDDHDR